MPAQELKVEDLERRVGTEVGVSPWIPVDQERIDLFARATDDHQWIHVDRERAKKGPFGGTIAHGFLTLSLLPRMAHETFSVTGVRLTVNYGLNRLRFTSPLPAGSRVRGPFALANLEKVDG